VDFHALVQLLIGAVTLASFVVVLMIKNGQAEVKADLLKQINATAKELAVHTAQDAEKFKALDDHLDRMEGNFQRYGAR